MVILRMKDENWITTIKLHQQTKVKLAKFGKFGDSYEDIVLDLMEP